MDERVRQRVSAATIARFHTYTRVLQQRLKDGALTVSSDALGHASGATAAVVRSDLATLGFTGTRGVGYDVRNLMKDMARALGLNQVQDVVVVGAGRLGTALVSYLANGAQGLQVAGAYDCDAQIVGRHIADVMVRDVSQIPFDDLSGALAVVTTPASAAQTVVDLLVTTGITSILNFAPTGLQVPSRVSLRNVDVAGELYVLGYFQRLGRGDQDG